MGTDGVPATGANIATGVGTREGAVVMFKYQGLDEKLGYVKGHDGCTAL